MAGSALFEVEAGQIAQIGYRLDDAHLRAWTQTQQKQMQEEDRA